MRAFKTRCRRALLLAGRKFFCSSYGGQNRSLRRHTPKRRLPPNVFNGIERGAAAFPSFDDFEKIKIEVHALTDSELKTVSANEIVPAELAKLMRSWFKDLIALSWLRLLADKGDDKLETWIDGSVIGDDLDNQSLWEIFIDMKVFSR